MQYVSNEITLIDLGPRHHHLRQIPALVLRRTGRKGRRAALHPPGRPAGPYHTTTDSSRTFHSEDAPRAEGGDQAHLVQTAVRSSERRLHHSVRAPARPAAARAAPGQVALKSNGALLFGCRVSR
jgi:hypothetical protein